MAIINQHESWRHDIRRRQSEGEQVPVRELVDYFATAMSRGMALPPAAIYDMYNALRRQIAPTRSAGASIRHTAPMLSLEDADALHTTLRRRSGRSGGAI